MADIVTMPKLGFDMAEAHLYAGWSMKVIRSSKGGV